MSYTPAIQAQSKFALAELEAVACGPVYERVLTEGSAGLGTTTTGKSLKSALKLSWKGDLLALSSLGSLKTTLPGPRLPLLPSSPNLIRLIRLSFCLILRRRSVSTSWKRMRL